MIPSIIKSALLVSGMSTAAIASGVAQEQLGWQRATQMLNNDASSQQSLAIAINQWRSLTQSSSQPFETYAAFLLAHPGWPSETQLRQSAESALASGSAASPSIVTAFFRRYPPVSNVARVRFAQALAALGSSADAAAAARAAWAGGSLPATDESAVLATWGGQLTPSDHNSRMDALLWQNALQAAARELPYVSADKRAVFAARLAFRTNASDAAAQAAAAQAAAGGDAGYIADRAVWLNNTAGPATARSYLASRPALTVMPGNREKWFELLLSNARGAYNDHQWSTAVNIARVDDAYPPSTDVSAQGYGERDDYTSLVWLAGRAALTQAGRPADAVGLFRRYSGGSKSPSVRSKGLYWAGRAAEAAGHREEANGFYAQAAEFHDLFYGQLAGERLGRALTAPPAPAPRTIDPAVRQAFYAREVVRAAQYLGTVSAWQDQTAFVRQIANDAHSDSDHVLASELSRSLGRPDLGVMIGRSALTNGITDYSTVAFPVVHVPADQQANWVMVHAIARQESQFDRAAVSRAGARGLMQLMPATARQTATQMGLTMASTDQLNSDTDFNLSVGGTYFARLYRQYGSYPLAVAAYNAGPGNVNRWLAANGDPRMGSVDWLDWIEAIPISETRNYVQRVLENAVVYDLLNPTRSQSSGANRLSWYIGKSRPG